MSYVYYLNADASTWSDTTIEEVMKKTQREYQKRFVNKKGNPESQMKILWNKSVRNELKKEEPPSIFCYNCKKDITSGTRVSGEGKIRCFDCFKNENNNSEDKLKQMTNNRDHYKGLYEEAQAKLDLWKEMYNNSHESFKKAANENIELHREIENLKNALQTARNLNGLYERDEKKLIEENERLKNNLESIKSAFGLNSIEGISKLLDIILHKV